MPAPFLFPTSASERNGTSWDPTCHLGMPRSATHSRALRHHILQSPEAVRSTGFDPEALVAQALAHEEAIASLATTRAVRVKGGTLAVTLRNQAVHFLLEAMREVRDNAAFAFAKDPKLSAALEGLGTLSVSAKRSDEDTGDEEEEEESQEVAQEEAVA